MSISYPGSSECAMRTHTIGGHILNAGPHPLRFVSRPLGEDPAHAITEPQGVALRIAALPLSGEPAKMRMLFVGDCERSCAQAGESRSGFRQIVPILGVR